MNRDATAMAALALFLCGLLSACQSMNDEVPKGSLKGSLVLAWDNSDERFIFIPAENDRLRYVTETGKLIEPKPMYTDGGSIPRFFWSVKGFSPWAYGPAYVVHDFLYNEHRCWKDKKDSDPSLPDFGFSRTEADAFLYDAMIIVEQKIREDVASGRIPGTDDAGFVGAQSRSLINTAVERFGRAAWEGEDGAVCLPEPERKFTVIVRDVPEGEAFISTSQRGVTGRVIKPAVRRENRMVEVRPTTLIRFSFD